MNTKIKVPKFIGKKVKRSVFHQSRKNVGKAFQDSIVKAQLAGDYSNTPKYMI